MQQLKHMCIIRSHVYPAILYACVWSTCAKHGLTMHNAQVHLAHVTRTFDPYSLIDIKTKHPSSCMLYGNITLCVVATDHFHPAG